MVTHPNRLRCACKEVCNPLEQCMTVSQSVEFGNQSGGDDGVEGRAEINK